MTDFPSSMPSLLPEPGDWPHASSVYGLEVGDPGPEWVALPDGLVGVLTYYWRTTTRPADIRLVAFTNELGRLYGALPDLDAFARGIVLIGEPEQ
ncbi:hypothetical protein [Streptomyces sp. NPDC091209]|uniref:hypothetical protein n=1 Tax=Streptomyces sp. NPDC091209 TaxID=3365974 RepID=UPI0038221721